MINIPFFLNNYHFKLYLGLVSFSFYVFGFLKMWHFWNCNSEESMQKGEQIRFIAQNAQC